MENTEEKTMKVSCAVCGAWKLFNPNASIMEIQSWDLLIWGLCEDKSYFAVCRKCSNANSSFSSLYKERKGERKEHKQIDKQEKVLYREI